MKKLLIILLLLFSFFSCDKPYTYKDQTYSSVYWDIVFADTNITNINLIKETSNDISLNLNNIYLLDVVRVFDQYEFTLIKLSNTNKGN